MHSESDFKVVGTIREDNYNLIYNLTNLYNK